MNEYLTVPERGIENALVTHILTNDGKRRLCDYELQEPRDWSGQRVLCERCRLKMMELVPEVKT